MSPERIEPPLIRTTSKTPTKKFQDSESQQVDFLVKVRQQLSTILESAEQMTHAEMESLANSIR